MTQPSSAHGLQQDAPAQHQDFNSTTAAGTRPDQCTAGTRARFAVLVVDDMQSARYALGRMLREAGFHTVEAAGGAQALQLAQYVSAVVLDINLPDVDGVEVCRLLRAKVETAHLPIIHLTAARIEEEDRDRSLAAGADEYLIAPVEPVVLVEAIERAINRR